MTHRQRSTVDFSGSHVRRNVELKARLASLRSARRTALRLATGTLGQLHQVDTYFDCRKGRLKLREIAGVGTQLIGYQRPDAADAKLSRYWIVDVGDADRMKLLLAETLGVRVVVDKRREVYLIDTVRIHLDRVRGLGTFLELEAVLEENEPERVGRQRLVALQEAFQIGQSDLVTGSYSDLVAAARGPAQHA